MPLLLEERSKEVQSHHDVSLELLIGHGVVTDSDGEAGNLLELELDGSSGILDLLGKRLSMGDDGGEHTNSVEDGSNNDGNLLQDSVGSEQESVFLGPLLNKLLVLVEFLEGVKIGNIDVQVVLLGFVLVLSISDEADSKLGTRNVGKSDGTNESLILLRIVILETNLELNSLLELSLLMLLAHLFNAFLNAGVGDLRRHVCINFLLINNYIASFPLFKR